MKETIKDIPLNKLNPFPEHPFGVRDDEAMQQTVESVREYGVLVPAIARPLEDGSYELSDTCQRKIKAGRAKRICLKFNEHIANEPKVSCRNGKHYVFDWATSYHSNP